jgi:hypothetical protein
MTTSRRRHGYQGRSRFTDHEFRRADRQTQDDTAPAAHKDMRAGSKAQRGPVSIGSLQGTLEFK